ncbi:low-density lipoprotein receptor-related protein 6-like isoform X2 [Corticium candelabrum]|uniref:low-density lipoprotein receptor-related protein 6-like isoform X2 n=1 Tax=Corticium candelabrum TaxID=121492 RepID=UPI002E269422|nr:low-density lipoprotein receptor-related protein 6-like isoform X2 [Corticium candelabrum]
MGKLLCVAHYVFVLLSLHTSQLVAKTLDNPPQLMFANQIDIRRVEANNKTSSPIVSNLLDVESLDFDVVNNRVYWTDVRLKRISRAFVNGTSVEEVPLREAHEPQALIIDWIGHNVIWSDKDPRLDSSIGMGRLWMMTIDGYYIRAILWKNVGRVRGLAVDPKTGFIFLLDENKMTIEKVLPDGSNRSVVCRDVSGVGLTIDYEERQIYWTDPNTNSIKFADLSGLNKRTLIENSRQLVFPYAITTLGKYVYWTDMHKRAVLVAQKTKGKQKSIIEDSVLSPYDIAAFDKGRQPDFHTECGMGQSGCSHFCLSIPPDYKCACPTGVKLLSDGKTCNNGLEKFLVYARRGDIRVLSLDVPLDETIDVILQLNTTDAIDVDYDVVDDRIYWIDNQEGKAVIGRGKNDGSAYEVVVNTLGAAFNGVAFDWISRNIYWMDTLFDRLMVSRLDGTFQKTLITTGLDAPRAVVVDPNNGYMYWTDWGRWPRIEKACLDGSNRTVLIDSQIKWPNGLTIDYEDRRLYWVDAYRRVMSSSDLWGKDQYTLSNIDLSHPYGLTIVGNHIYWTDWNRRNIQRVDKKSGSGQEVVLDSVIDIMGLQGVDKRRQKGSNACSTKNGGCSHLCLPRPGDRSCACPNGFVFIDAQKTQCQASTPAVLYTHFTVETGDIHSVPITANSRGKSLVTLSTVINPVAVAYDIVEGKFYWSDATRNEIRRANLEGTLEMELIVRFGSANPGGLAVDWMGRSIYWTVFNSDRIDVAKLNGELRTPFKWRDITKPMALTVEPQEGLLYWSTNTNTPQIQSAQLNDSSKVDTIATLAKGESPSCLTIDHSTRRLFWTDEYHVYVVNLNDKFRVKVAVLQVKQGLSLRPSGISFFNGKLYWANLETEKVEYAVTELTNELKNVKALSTIPGLTNDNNIVDVTVVDYSLQESINQCSARNGDCSHYCLSRQGNKFQCGCPLYMEIDYANVRLNSVCRVPQSLLVYAAGKSVYFVNLTASSAIQNQSDPPFLLDVKSDIVKIELDMENSRIFWIDKNGRLYGSMLDGTDWKVLVRAGKVFDMAVNHVTGQVFYTNEESDTIEGVSPHGSSIGVIIDSQQLHPRSLALDSNTGLLYWTDWGMVPSIRKAELDGRNHRQLISTKLTTPTRLTLDVSQAILYWTDMDRSVIEACDAAGNNRRTVQHVVMNVFTGLAEGGKYLYYTVPRNGSIMRLNKSLDASSLTLTKGLQIRVGLVNVSDIVIYEHKRLPVNPCSESNGNCSHLCIPTADGGHRCACPVNRKLQENQLTCSGPTCPGSDEVLCSDNSKCILRKQVCDGKPQCQDASDEESGCLCHENEWRCPSGKCILSSAKCDLYPDCPNDWDEHHSNCPCREGFKHCEAGGECIEKVLFCDGTPDCRDESDEANCDQKNLTVSPVPVDESSSSSSSLLGLIVSCVTAGVLFPVVIIFIVVKCKLMGHRKYVFPPAPSDNGCSTASHAQDSSYGGSRLTESILLEKMRMEQDMEGLSVYAEGLLPFPGMPCITVAPTDGDTAFSMPPPMGGPMEEKSEYLYDPPPSVVSGMESMFSAESSHVANTTRHRQKSSGSRYRHRNRSNSSDYRPPVPCPSTAQGHSSEGDTEGSSDEESSRSRMSRRSKTKPSMSPPPSVLSGSRFDTDWSCAPSLATVGDLCPPPPPTVVSDFTETAC